MQIKAIDRFLSAAAFTLIALATLCSPSTAAAKSRTAEESPAACPVSVKSFNTEHDVLYFYYENTAGKDVDGVMFDAAYYDSEKKIHHIDVWGNYNTLVHPGQRKRGALDVKFLHDTGATGVALWPTKVLYRDHTSWSMSEQRASCAVIQREHIQQAGLMPPSTGGETYASVGY